MCEWLSNLLRDQRAVTAVEYSLILCLMVLVLLAGVTSLGSANTAQWNYVSTQVSGAISQANS